MQQRQIPIEAKQLVEGDGGYRQHLDLIDGSRVACPSCLSLSLIVTPAGLPS